MLRKPYQLYKCGKQVFSKSPFSAHLKQHLVATLESVLQLLRIFILRVRQCLLTLTFSAALTVNYSCFYSGL